MKLILENWNKFLNEEEGGTNPIPSEEFKEIMSYLNSDRLNEGFMQDLASTVRHFAKPLAVLMVLGGGVSIGSSAYEMVQNTQNEITAQIQDSEDPQQELKDHYDNKIEETKMEISKLGAEADYYENKKGDLQGAQKFREKAFQLEQVLEDLETRQEHLISPAASEYFTAEIGDQAPTQQAPADFSISATTGPGPRI